MAINRYIMFEQQAFATETFVAFGAAALAHPIDQVSEDINTDHGFVNPVTSSKRAPRNRLLGPVLSGGDIGVPMYSMGFPTLAYYALGSAATIVGNGSNGAATGAFVHTFTPGNAVPAYRMAIGKDVNEHQFVGCGMKSLKMDYSVDNPALATFDTLVRKELAPAALATPTFPDYDVAERSFLGVEVTAEIDDTITTKIRSASVEINNTLVEDNHTFGDRFLPELIVQDLEVKGNVTMTFSDIVNYNQVRNEDEIKLELLFTHGTFQTLPARDVSIILPRLSLDTVNLPTDGNKEYILSIDFTAQAVNNDDEVIQIQVVNEEDNATVTA
jgi:hypothetical protein